MMPTGEYYAYQHKLLYLILEKISSLPSYLHAPKSTINFGSQYRNQQVVQFS